MLEKLDLDDDGKLPIAIFADLVLTFSCVCVCARVCVFVRVCARYLHLNQSWLGIMRVKMIKTCCQIQVNVPRLKNKKK